VSKGKALALAITLSLIGGLLLGGLGVYLWFTLLAPKTAGEPANVAVQVPEPAEQPEPEPDVPEAVAAPVLTYANKQYGVTFSYPEDWNDTNVDALTAAESPLYGFAETDVTFASVAEGVPVVRITSMDELESVDSEVVNDALSNLRSAYSSSDAAPVTGGDIVLPINAGAYYFTAPQYVESADGSFRGYYYYGLFGNGVPPEEGPVPMQVLHAVLTNGDAVVQLTATTEKTKPAKSVTCDAMESLPALTCTLPTVLATTVTEDLLALVETLE